VLELALAGGAAQGRPRSMASQLRGLGGGRPRFYSPPCLATYPIGREANASAPTNLRPIEWSARLGVGGSMLIMVWYPQWAMGRLRSMDDADASWPSFERVVCNRFLIDFFVFWIVKRLPQKGPRWLHQNVAEKRATPVVSLRRVSRAWWCLKYT
jgi:hypothetical protein